MDNFAKYIESSYIDEIYEYSAESFDISGEKKSSLSIGVWATIFFVIINLPFQIKLSENIKCIGITRGPLHKKVLERTMGNIPIINDDIRGRSFSIYRIGKRSDRIKYVFSHFLRDSRRDQKEIQNIIKGLDVSTEKKKQLTYFFDKRIAHTVYFKWALNVLLHSIHPHTVAVSYTHDRFSLVTEEICRDNYIHLICIPHGEIENPGLPRRYPGDKVYVLNDQVANIFNQAYNTDAYVYDYEILKKIYHMNYKKTWGRRVVYLMTPYFFVNEQLDMVERISKYLATRSTKLYIKQHPIKRYELESADNIIELDSLEEAVCGGNLCIGFFTTALIDAIFNESSAISTLRILDEETLYKKNKDVFEGCGVFCAENEANMYRKIDEYLKETEQ